MAENSSTTEKKTLEHFYSNVLSKEPTVRLECFPALEIYLSNENTSLECDDLTGFIHGLFKWIEGSNFRIACNGLRALDLFLNRLDHNDFERFLDIVISLTVDRLGDAKDQVREISANLLMKLMHVYTTQRIWDLMLPLAFDNKQARIKEETQRLLVRTLNEFGASTIQLNKLVPLICKLVSDSNGTVRQQAIDTLVEIYRHVGEKVRGDIAKRDLPEAKLKQLYEKFDDVVASGRMIAKSTVEAESSSSLTNTRPKSASTQNRRDSDSSSISRSRANSGIPSRTSVTTSSTGVSTAASSGAVDEASFEEAINATPSIPLSSGKDVENQLISIREILADTNNDWEKRAEALKRMRSILLGGADDYDEFFRNLRPLDLPLVSTIKDLRSQVVREACITLAFMSVRLTNRFERTAEGVIPAMLNLIQNSAKVMATSGVVAMNYIVTHTHSSKLVPLILSGIDSKSKDIRRHTFSLLVVILSVWDSIYLDKHGQLIYDVIKKGLSDADAEARANARRSFGYFRDQFPSLADALLASLDSSKKKTLLGEMSNASSTHSLASVGSSRIRSVKEPAKSSRLINSDKTGSTGNLARSSSANELALRNKSLSSTGSNFTTPPPQPASARPRYSAQPNISRPTSASGSRPPASVSQSQPGSRSTSPHSLRSSQNLSSSIRTPTNARSRIPIGSNNGSRISSRESSPGRTRAYGDHSTARRVSGSWCGDSGDDASETSSICSERSLEDIADVIRRMSSNEWAERKDGLTSLYHMIRAGRTFGPTELKRLTELLTKRFYESNSQVLTTFLEVLPEFINAYKRDLNEWLYTLLTRLLMRMGAADILESTYKKFKSCLLIVNSSFDVHAQFIVLIRFINDNSQAPGVKAKEILLRYLQQTIQHLEPVDMANNIDIRTALAKIIGLANDPKSLDVRKAANAVILALNNLNRPEFNLMLTTLPPTSQETAAKIIRSGNEMQSSTHSTLDNKFDFFQRTIHSGLTSPMTSSIHSEVQGQSYASDMRILMENMQALNVNHRHDDFLPTNSKDQDVRSTLNRQYAPHLYRTQPTTETNDNVLDTIDRPAMIDLALTLANDANLPKDQRQQALRSIFKLSKLNDPETWEIAFSKTLNVVTQILDNPTDEMVLKTYSLRILRELLIQYTSLFFNYIELTIFRILKAQSEIESEITRAAEQAAHAAAEYLPAEHTVRVLKPIIEQAKYPMNQSAISMLQKTIELMPKDICIELTSEIVPILLTSWESENSSVRKAAVFCLVAIYLAVGEQLRTHLNKLSASKLKLLNVYISKAQQQTNSNSGTGATASSNSSDKTTKLNGN